METMPTRVLEHIRPQPRHAGQENQTSLPEKGKQNEVAYNRGGWLTLNTYVPNIRALERG
jgi:hypothetical protein